MKILFINNTLFTPGGVERVLSVLASELAKDNEVTLLSRGSEKAINRQLYGLSESVHVLLWKDDYAKLYLRRAVHKLNQKTGILKYLNSKFLYDWIYIPKKIQSKWIDFINKHQFDVVCGVQGNNAIILGKIKPHLKCITIGWQHSSYEAYLETKGVYHYNQDFLFDTYVPSLDHYVVLNEHDEQMFMQKKRIKATTIYNPKSFSTKEKASLENKIFLACGSLRYTKGFDLLINSFELFSKNDQEWALNIFGTGSERDSLQKMIDSKGLSNRVFLRGITNEIAKEMINSSVLLLSSRWEGMPMVVLEALECGLPIISYNINAIKPLVDDGVEGRIVPSYDINAYAQAMFELSRSKTERTFFGVNASKKASLFSPEEIGNKWRLLMK